MRDFTKPDTDEKTLITKADDDLKTGAYSVSADNQFVWYRRNWKQVDNNSIGYW